jgi:hypothetical protein
MNVLIYEENFILFFISAECYLVFFQMFDILSPRIPCCREQEGVLDSPLDIPQPTHHIFIYKT